MVTLVMLGSDLPMCNSLYEDVQPENGLGAPCKRYVRISVRTPGNSFGARQKACSLEMCKSLLARKSLLISSQHR